MLLQVVVKVSKFCNLRCTYCYEMKELGDRTRMAVGDLATMFRHFADYAASRPGLRIWFIWHGGEPLLQSPGFYREVFAAQKEILRGLDEVRNVVTTNLTVLDDDRLALLKDDFDGVAVSMDLFGEHRLNIAGRSSQQRVLENMDRLMASGIRYGCITVLTRRNLARVDDIFRFYERTGLSFRMLPLFEGAEPEQHLGYEVTATEVLAGLCRVFDLWMASDTQIEITPVITQLRDVLEKRRGGYVPRYHDRRSREDVMLVNTNGDIYAQADAWVPGRSWGNVFRTPLTEIIGSEQHLGTVVDTERRLAATCVHCEYFGVCTGFAVGEDNRRYVDTRSHGRQACVVEYGLYRHIERRVSQAEQQLGERFWERVAGATRPESTLGF